MEGGRHGPAGADIRRARDRGGPQQPVEAEADAAHRLYGEIQQMRETAEGVASAVARLTTVLPPEHPR